MNHHRTDLLYFVSLAPSISLSTPSRAARFLTWQLGQEQTHRLRDHANVDAAIEALEFHLATVRGLGALQVGGPDFLHAMMCGDVCGWRGLVWGGWLALMAEPTPAMEATLRQAVDMLAHPRAIENGWAARAALAALEGREPEEELREVLGLVSQVRDLLGGVPIRDMPLRDATDAQDAHVVAEREAIRAAYRSGGLEAAQVAKRGTRAEELAMTYPDWYRLKTGEVLRG